MSTPMMRQWEKLRKQHPDTVLFFQAGDFYELYYEHAKIGHKELNITLTARKLKNEQIPMAGVPLHSIEKYILQLIKKGYKVAICDQVEDAQASKGIVKRDVVQVITPGTIFGDHLLDGAINNYLVALVQKGSHIGLAMTDISTGEFSVTEFIGVNAIEELKDEINRLNPAEILLPENLFDDAELNSILKQDHTMVLTPVDTYYSSYENAYKLLTSHFGTLSLDGYGVEPLRMGICAAGMIIHYLQETQKSTELCNITRITPYSLKEYMILDDQTLRSLEILRNLRDGTSQFTLLEMLDQTQTPMGSRLLKKWLRRPLLNKERIQERLDAVEVFVTDTLLRANVRELLGNIGDIERIISKVGLGKANGRDLLALNDSLLHIPELKTLLDKDSKLLSTVKDHLYDLSELVQLIERSIQEECPLSVREGNIIKLGFNKNLDELRSVLSEGKDWILEYETKERRRTGFDKLKVGFNNVFGYYIEITKATLRKGKIPEGYTRKQTLVNSERFITPELRQYEDKILGADEKIKNLEYELFCEIRQEVAKEIDKIQENAQSIAILDCLSTFAEIAAQNHYFKPNMVDGDEIFIEDGRHPVVERIIGEENFIPNDTHLDSYENQILIITGPNMSGKSTYLRQVALIVLMAQIGSFVPARTKLGICDRIFTRVGAWDFIAMQQSTFMVEMIEVANILNNATAKSLIILDEVGRGTSTYDGMALAWAITEFLHQNSHSAGKTLFATHYHQLNQLAEYYPRIKNYQFAVKRKGQEILFLHKILSGGTDRSYGVEVARLAGLPQTVVTRAKEILDVFEGAETPTVLKSKRLPTGKPQLTQLTLFDINELNSSKSEGLDTMEELSPKRILGDKIIDELKNLNLDHMTPLDALNKLHELKNKLNDEDRA
ncbi:MAG: DNA mismatch repair protein MutS [Promethearchaeota archaeon]